MKKARIFLSVIAVVAVIGGVFAFTPAKFGQRNVYCPVAQPVGNSYCILQPYSTIEVGAGESTFNCPNLSFVYTATTTNPQGSTVCVTTATTTQVYNTIDL